MTHYIQGRPTIEMGGSRGVHLGDVELIETEIVDKNWGSEEILHNNAHCVKKMSLNPGMQVSMHWHEAKEETFILISGTLIIETITQDGELRITELTNQLESFTLCRNVPHTFYCPDGQQGQTVFIEASTTDHKNDSFRIFPSGHKRTIDNR